MLEQKSPFDKNTVVAIVICIGVLFGWQMYLEKKYPAAMSTTGNHTVVKNERALPQPVTANAEKAEAEAAAAVKEPVNAGPEVTKTYEDTNSKITISSRGGRISQVVLKKYTDTEGKPIELVTPSMPGYLLTRLTGTKTPAELSKLNYDIKQNSPTQFVLSASHAGVKIQKTFNIVPEEYIVNVETVISGQLDGAQSVTIDLEEPSPSAGDSSGGLLNIGRRAGNIQEYYFAHGTKKNRDYVTAKKEIKEKYDQTAFAALGSRYFTSLIFNRGNVIPDGMGFRQGPNSVLRMSYPILDTKGPVELNYTLYSGPKLLSTLNKVDSSAKSVVDFGMFWFIAVPILKLMKLLNHLFRNYGVSIIALTILMRAITYPFTYMSYKSMKAMQQIQPEIARLKQVHKDNQMALNQEMMKLMRENKVNPMGGCLPMVLQLPVFWALYQVLENSIELYHSPFVLWIHDLSVKDPYYILPVLMGVTMFIQQKITPSTMDPAQARMMLIMPVFFSLLMFNLPSGLTLYIFVSTLFGIIQQVTMMQDRKTGPVQAVMRRT